MPTKPAKTRAIRRSLRSEVNIHGRSFKRDLQSFHVLVSSRREAGTAQDSSCCCCINQWITGNDSPIMLRRQTIHNDNWKPNDTRVCMMFLRRLNVAIENEAFNNKNARKRVTAAERARQLTACYLQKLLSSTLKVTVT